MVELTSVEQQNPRSEFEFNPNTTTTIPMTFTGPLTALRKNSGTSTYTENQPGGDSPAGFSCSLSGVKAFYRILNESYVFDLPFLIKQNIFLCHIIKGMIQIFLPSK